MQVYVTGMGVVTPAGCGMEALRMAIRQGKGKLRPIGLFSVPKDQIFPVGDIPDLSETDGLPRTHRLALTAAREAMAGCRTMPDAVVMGVTTGGMLTTEKGLKDGESDPQWYRNHSTGSVAACVAKAFDCRGPAITVSTACSSGAVAITVALRMLQNGRARRVLAGGADSLCRLTYHGFNGLQLIDPIGARPLDVNRRGMSVAEGAAVLLLCASEHVPENAVARVLGAGLSCDAYHASAPHPEGEGAARAMRGAMEDAGINAGEIDYISLHGTGTLDNDLSEARAICRLFPRDRPMISSIKGAFGHSLGAAGAVEAVVSVLAVSEGVIPASVGCDVPDPALGLEPVLRPLEGAAVQTVLSNSFGFGGNNAAIIIGASQNEQCVQTPAGPVSFEILGSACLTGAGDTVQSISCLYEGKPCWGRVPDETVTQNLPSRVIRRLKRWPRMALCMAEGAMLHGGRAEPPGSVFLGTGWGALSETHDFLSQLFESDGLYSSPIDFVGSVHNAAAGQLAIRFGATGPNITATGGDDSFEQALMLAGLLSKDSFSHSLVMAGDEYHEKLSGLLDSSVRIAKKASDGGGCLLVRPLMASGRLSISLMFYEKNHSSAIPALVATLGEAQKINETYGAVLAGIPAHRRKQGAGQMAAFIRQTGFLGPVIDYRRFVGEFATASAVAAVLAAHFVQRGVIGAGAMAQTDVNLRGKGILLLGFGDFITAVGVSYGRDL